MSRPVISSVYRRYADDTEQLVEWLCRAAIGLGYSDSTVIRVAYRDPADTPHGQAYQGAEQKEKPGKPSKTALKNAKAKARAKAKKASAEGLGQAAAGAGPGKETVNNTTDAHHDTPAAKFYLPPGDYIVRTADLETLALYISSQQYDVPNEVLKLMERCTRQRDRLHRYLTGPQDLFQSAAGGYEDQEAIILPKPPHQSSFLEKVSFSIEPDMYEATIRVLAFFIDDKVTLVTASIVSNTALELLADPHHHLVEDVFPTILDVCGPPPDGWTDTYVVLKSLCRSVSLARGMPEFDMDDWRTIPGDDPRFALMMFLLVPQLYTMRYIRAASNQVKIHEPKSKPASIEVLWMAGRMYESTSLLYIALSDPETASLWQRMPMRHLLFRDETKLILDDFANGVCDPLMLVAAQAQFDNAVIICSTPKYDSGPSILRAELQRMLDTFKKLKELDRQCRAIDNLNWKDYFRCDLDASAAHVQLLANAYGVPSLGQVEYYPALFGQVMFSLQLRLERHARTLDFCWPAGMLIVQYTRAHRDVIRHHGGTPPKLDPDLKAYVDMYAEKGMPADDNPLPADPAVAYLVGFMSSAGFDEDARRAVIRSLGAEYNGTGESAVVHIMPFAAWSISELLKQRYDRENDQFVLCNTPAIGDLVRDLLRTEHAGGDGESQEPASTLHQHAPQSSISIMQFLSVLELGMTKYSPRLQTDHLGLHVRFRTAILKERDRLQSHPMWPEALGPCGGPEWFTLFRSVLFVLFYDLAVASKQITDTGEGVLVNPLAGQMAYSGGRSADVDSWTWIKSKA